MMVMCVCVCVYVCVCVLVRVLCWGWGGACGHAPECVRVHVVVTGAGNLGQSRQRGRARGGARGGAREGGWWGPRACRWLPAGMTYIECVCVCVF